MWMCVVIAQLEQKAEELSDVQKNVVDLHCETDVERSKWLADKSQLQADLGDALKDRDEQREKAAQLNAEVPYDAPASHVISTDVLLESLDRFTVPV